MKKISLKDLIKPKRVEFESDEEDRFYGKFVLEPLERGFGSTIGNSIRRILLSSLQGAAVTSVKFDGVMHEFSTIQGVVEDVAEIILNLKEVRIALDEKDRCTLRVDVNGPCDVKAGMLQGDGSAHVINTGAHIATISQDSKLSFEVQVRSGRGYCSAERNKEEEAPAGTIYIDSIFSPVKRVNMIVSNSRVGQQTDYDKLVLEIWTDGTIDPRFALAQASHVLVDQLSVFVGEHLVIEEIAESPEEPKRRLNENLFRRIDELELSVRSANCLENADIKYIGELVQKSEHEMLRTKNFGRKSLNEIKELLTEMSLSLGMKLDEFPPRSVLEKQPEINAATMQTNQ
jgi:DNA-directed RNA polymerase subunit alpha